MNTESTGRDVWVCEVGPRDGLQIIAEIMPTAAKLEWIASEAAAGIPEIEVCSFVPPKLLPQFGDADEVAAAALQHPGLTVTALVPNLRGAERAFHAGVHKVNFVLSASESHNQQNVRRSTAESLQDFERIVELRNSREAWRHIQLCGGVSTAFGCTIEGAIDEDTVVKLAEQYAQAGADKVSIADTVGYANPVQVKRMFTRLGERLGGLDLTAHFHDTRGLGLANVYAALEAGVRSFDASLGGMGGCPWAPGATGNIVTEDLVYLLESAGLRTGVDLERLLQVRRVVRAALPEIPLHGALAQAGLPKGLENRAADCQEILAKQVHPLGRHT
ncbi:MAG TPA: hydroxymethylglutaryl-CoA lyase [Bryobacteraceae bacterium]|nr:hydroxymethylglutaryl-CoA lyase [Bryobacteraceae bacterium]